MATKCVVNMCPYQQFAKYAGSLGTLITVNVSQEQMFPPPYAVKCKGVKSAGG